MKDLIRDGMNDLYWQAFYFIKGLISNISAVFTMLLYVKDTLPTIYRNSAAILPKRSSAFLMFSWLFA